MVFISVAGYNSDDLFFLCIFSVWPLLMSGKRWFIFGKWLGHDQGVQGLCWQWGGQHKMMTVIDCWGKEETDGSLLARFKEAWHLTNSPGVGWSCQCHPSPNLYSKISYSCMMHHCSTYHQDPTHFIAHQSPVFSVERWAIIRWQVSPSVQGHILDVVVAKYVWHADAMCLDSE